MESKSKLSTGLDPSAISLGNLQVMLFDSDRTSAGVTKLALQQTNQINFKYFTEQKSALMHHQDQPFDVALVDFTPATTNTASSLITSLRDPTRFSKSVRVVALLGTPSKPMLQAVIKAGADTAWVKPLSPRGILQKLKTLLKADIDYVVLDEYVGPDRRRVPGDLGYMGEERRQMLGAEDPDPDGD